MQANAYANGKLVAEAELMAQIAKKQVKIRIVYT
jgi:UDP-3-O-[3-hydroxymyristoyl] N-acetylglucosamine deacetylase/3-hydroxyacyl-[acyl-carrier-protein] dehydratase